MFGSTRKTCLSIYKKAKKKRPNKTERDYLKIVLLTKPPFDYQLDKIIESILDECETIDELSSYIEMTQKDKNLWSNRERNLDILEEKGKNRNEQFLIGFWD